MTSTTLSPPTTGRRHATWANLGLTYVLGLGLLSVQSLGYHHWSHGDNQLSSDIAFYVVSGLIGVAIAAIGIARVRRSRRAGTPGTVGTVLGVLAVVVARVCGVTYQVGG